MKNNAILTKWVFQIVIIMLMLSPKCLTAPDGIGMIFILIKEISLTYLNITIMLRSKTGLLLAGLAAYAAYRYSKMDPTKKKDLVDSIKTKGKDLVDRYVPQNVRDQFNKATHQEETFRPA
jgi:hypothetical protein